MPPLTYKVDNVRELGAHGDNDSFKIYLVIGQKRHHIRSMTIKQLRDMRTANEVPDRVSDTEFLFGDPQFRKFMSVIANAEGTVPTIEFTLHTMSPKKGDRQRVEFPANAFEGGTTKSLNT